MSLRRRVGGPLCACIFVVLTPGRSKKKEKKKKAPNSQGYGLMSAGVLTNRSRLADCSWASNRDRDQTQAMRRHGCKLKNWLAAVGIVSPGHSIRLRCRLGAAVSPLAELRSAVRSNPTNIDVTVRHRQTPRVFASESLLHVGRLKFLMTIQIYVHRRRCNLIASGRFGIEGQERSLSVSLNVAHGAGRIPNGAHV